MHEDDIERLLKSTGPRTKPPEDFEREARERLRLEWLAATSANAERRRRSTLVTLAAAGAALAIAVWVAAQDRDRTAEPVASTALIAGDVRIKRGWLSGWSVATAGQRLLGGQTLETGKRGRAALQLDNGISLRVDRESRLELEAVDELMLERGAMYVDVRANASREAKLLVQTPSGSVRHVGTQYEVRLLETGVRLRVREGHIEWMSSGGRTETSRAGEQLVIGYDGSVARSPMQPYGQAWRWVAAVTPVIDIDGLALPAFLSWAGRELGCDVVYSSPDVAREAAAITVHGSIDGLTPTQALEAVLATTSVRSSVRTGRILIERLGTSAE